MSRLGCLTVRVAPTKCYLEHGGVIGSNMGRVDGYAGVQPGETAVIIFMPGYGVRTRQGSNDSSMCVSGQSRWTRRDGSRRNRRPMSREPERFPPSPSR